MKDAKASHDVSQIIFTLRGIYKDLCRVYNLRWGMQDFAIWNRGFVKWTISKRSEKFENVISFVTTFFSQKANSSVNASFEA